MCNRPRGLLGRALGPRNFMKNRMPEVGQALPPANWPEGRLLCSMPQWFFGPVARRRASAGAGGVEFPRTLNDDVSQCGRLPELTWCKTAAGKTSSLRNASSEVAAAMASI
jgi:hypothetical protein